MNSHFSYLLERGACPGCSAGERGTRALAVAIWQYLPILDSDAQAGLHQFIDLVATDTGRARDYLERHGCECRLP